MSSSLRRATREYMNNRTVPPSRKVSCEQCDKPVVYNCRALSRTRCETCAVEHLQRRICESEASGDHYWANELCDLLDAYFERKNGK